MAFTVTRGVAFSSITNNGLLTIEQFAPVGEKVKIICSFDGVNSIEYTFVIVAGDNATDDIPLSTEPIYATGIKIAAVRRAFDGAIINENNKARPGDVLTVDIEFLPFNTTEGNKNFILTVNGINKEYALINGNQITITALNDIYCDNPTFNLRVSTIQNGKEIINDYDTVINIYVPVENFTIKTTEIQRGQFNDLNILFNKNGFASNKELYLDAYYEITNTSGVTGIYVDFENNKIFIPKFAPAGTTVSGCLYSKDNHDNKIPFLLTVKALDVSGYSFTYGNYTNGIFISNVDSKGRYIPSADNAQLEENCYIHILGKFKSEDPLEYGVETQFAINSNDATIGKTSGLLTIKKDAKGSNTVKYTITFIDGNSTYTKEINVKVFNAVNKVNLTNTMVTSNYTCLYVTSSDSLASSSSDSYSFTTVNRTDYSLTADGYLTIKDKTKNDQPISITFTYSQVYNGNAINVYSTTEELDVKIKTSAAKSSLSEKFVTGNLNTSWTTWRTLETLPTYALDYAMLRSINYTEFCVKYKSFISVVGLVAYEIRLYNVSTKTILQTMPIHEPSNGNNVNRDDLFSVDLSEVDSWDTIEIQIRYRKTGVFWAGEFTLSGQELSFCVE